MGTSFKRLKHGNLKFGNNYFAASSSSLKMMGKLVSDCGVLIARKALVSVDNFERIATRKFFGLITWLWYVFHAWIMNTENE
jgi:hypothetical protein